MRIASFLLSLLVLAACGEPKPSQADGDAACRSSGVCAQDGACWFAPMVKFDKSKPIGMSGFSENQCEARSDRDCLQSERCKEVGACSYNPESFALYQCVPKSVADCMLSDACKHRDLCKPDVFGCTDVVPLETCREFMTLAERCGKKIPSASESMSQMRARFLLLIATDATAAEPACKDNLVLLKEACRGI